MGRFRARPYHYVTLERDSTDIWRESRIKERLRARRRTRHFPLGKSITYDLSFLHAPHIFPRLRNGLKCRNRREPPARFFLLVSGAVRSLGVGPLFVHCFLPFTDNCHRLTTSLAAEETIARSVPRRAIQRNARLSRCPTDKCSRTGYRVYARNTDRTLSRAVAIPCLACKSRRPRSPNRPRFRGRNTIFQYARFRGKGKAAGRGSGAAAATKRRRRAPAFFLSFLHSQTRDNEAKQKTIKRVCESAPSGRYRVGVQTTSCFVKITAARRCPRRPR